MEVRGGGSNSFIDLSHYAGIRRVVGLSEGEAKGQRAYRL